MEFDDPTRAGCLCRSELDVTQWCERPVIWAGLRMYPTAAGGLGRPARAFACDLHARSLVALVAYGSHPEHFAEMCRRA